MPPQETSEFQMTRDGGIGSSVWLGRIVCGDNSEILAQMPSECIDLVVTSPPYDDLRTYGGHSWNFEAVARELTRVLKPGGVIVWVVADATVNGSETLTSMRQAIHFKDVCGLNIHDTMIYLNEKPPQNGPRYEQQWEMMLVLAKGKPKSVNLLREKSKHAGVQWVRTMRQKDGTLKDSHSPMNVAEMKVRGNVWRCPNNNENANGHPAPFPERLVKDHVASWSNPGDVILDPFAGSGTTLKAAKELNRQWCGIEINPEYVKIAEARLSQDVLQLETCDMRPNVPDQR